MLSIVVLGRTGIFTVALPPDRPVTIGRAQGSDIRLDDASVSRTHARLTVTGDRVAIVDLESSQGTVVGSRQLRPGEIARLVVGDTLQVGATTLLVEQAQESLRMMWGADEVASQFEALRGRSDAAARAFSVVYIGLRVADSGDAETTGRAAKQLERARRAHGTLGRALHALDALVGLGRGEYLALLAETSRTVGDERMDRLARDLAAGGFAFEIGLASYPEDGETRGELERQARLRASGESRAPEKSRALGDLALIVERVAPGTLSVLVSGETGVGKEVLARSIHDRSSRASGPLVSLNCAALSETLLEGELFGYEKGAFTGATHAKQGLLETADGGTIFLDEVGEMPPSLQVKLLRVIEQRELTRVGALVPRPIDVRFIAATHRDLEEEVARGRFRQDLFYRLNGIMLHVPPLRERTGEIEPLAREFIARATPAGARPPSISAAVLERLKRHPWPGNIRELRNVIERAVLLCTGEELRLEHVPAEMMTTLLPVATRASRPAAPSTLPPASLLPRAGIERDHIVDALRTCAGNQTKAALLLGISRRTLVSYLTRLELPRPRKRAS